MREDGPYTTGQIAQWPRLESSCHAFQFHQYRGRRTVVKGTLGYIFQDLNHFQAECAIRVRPSAAHAAFDEVFDFDKQGFDIAETGRYHVAESVSKLVLPERFGLLQHDASVINFYLFARLGIVI